MKISVENLGVLKQAEFELSDLTIICGNNNTGKTYATYALFGFLKNWKYLLDVDIPDEKVTALLNDGVTQIDVMNYFNELHIILNKGCSRYIQQLPRIFASRATRFRNTTFQVELEPEEIPSITSLNFEHKEGILLSQIKLEGDTNLVVSLLVDKSTTAIPLDLIKHFISNSIIEIIFGRIFPDPFIASTERTGAAIFRKELNFSRNRLLEEMAMADKDIDPMELLFKSYQDYALPVKINVDFTRQLESIAKTDSFLFENHPQILEGFSDIIGGEYSIESNDILSFKPTAEKHLKLAMDESSSAVRSMLDVGFYLRHVAKPGDLLMIDEPELSLHPENQRRIARLFARLLNVGIRVFMTTHSDYIVKELNTLIMLNQSKPYLKQIAEEEGYQSEEFIDANIVRVYVAEKALIKLRDNKRKSQCQTLLPANIDQEGGIEARSFDNTINKMNKIQEAIVWGGDE